MASTEVGMETRCTCFFDMTIALCQINPIVGDLAGNVRRILVDAGRAAEAGAEMAVFPELCLTGYPPMDLLDRPRFIAEVWAAVQRVAREAPRGMSLIVGAPVWNDEDVGKRLLNAALVLEEGRITQRVAKTLLPTYDVFDEYRYFEPENERRAVTVRGLRLGLHLCEDMWNNEAQASYHLYAANPIDELAADGAELFVNLSASPFAVGKPAERAALIAESCREHRLPFVYVNQVGANTELLFDGDSRVHGPDGAALRVMASFEEDFAVWNTDDLTSDASAQREAPAPIAQVHDALVMGIRDYVAKTGESVFPKALVGLSGGIDSAVTCALAAEALGPDRVVGITLPSRHSSGGSVTDSQALAANLGIDFHEVPIEPAVSAFEEMLGPLFEGTEEGVAEENIQARSRGLTLMAVSNKFGYLLLTTGNKSEMAVGYATLYGDMSGGLAVLADVLKTGVYDLAEHINERAATRGGSEVIPRSTITKPPSAELRPDQTDQDALPPYDVLDAVLERYIERHDGVDVILAETGLDEKLVTRVIEMVDRNEYKRRQAAPGLRVSEKAFGIGRRLPIVMQRTCVTPFGEETP